MSLIHMKPYKPKMFAMFFFLLAAHPIKPHLFCFLIVVSWTNSLTEAYRWVCDSASLPMWAFHKCIVCSVHCVSKLPSNCHIFIELQGYFAPMLYYDATKKLVFQDISDIFDWLTFLYAVYGWVKCCFISTNLKITFWLPSLKGREHQKVMLHLNTDWLSWQSGCETICFLEP